MSEDDAIRLCQEGERAPFQILVERYNGVLFGTAFLMTRDRSLAEDFVQEAFLLAWRGIRTFNPGTNFKAWVVRILVNSVIGERRKKRVAETPIGDGFDVPSEKDLPETWALRAEERQQMLEALDTLPEDQREPVVLRYYADLTIPEIARAVGVREGTVKSRLHRSLERLRNVLKEKDVASAVAAKEGDR